MSRNLVFDVGTLPVPSDMAHATFGGRTHPSGYGWAALSKASLLLGAPSFLGGMPVLKHLPVKISEFLHHVHGEKFSSLGVPHPGGGGQSRPTLLQLDKLSFSFNLTPSIHASLVVCLFIF